MREGGGGGVGHGTLLRLPGSLACGLASSRLLPPATRFLCTARISSPCRPAHDRLLPSPPMPRRDTVLTMSPDDTYDAFQELGLPDPLTDIEAFQTNATINETLQTFIADYLLPPGSDLANVTGIIPANPPDWFMVRVPARCAWGRFGGSRTGRSGPSPAAARGNPPPVRPCHALPVWCLESPTPLRARHVCRASRTRTTACGRTRCSRTGTC